MKSLILSLALVSSLPALAANPQTCLDKVSFAVAEQIAKGHEITEVSYVGPLADSLLLKMYSVNTHPVATEPDAVGFEGTTNWYVIVEGRPSVTPVENPEPASCTVKGVIHHFTAF